MADKRMPVDGRSCLRGELEVRNLSENREAAGSAAGKQKEEDRQGL